MADLGLLIGAAWRLPGLLRRERWTRAQLEAHQARALRGLRDFAYSRSPFYRRFHAGRQQAPLQDLPVLTKALMMKHFDELVTDRDVRLAELERFMAGARTGDLFHGRYLVCATSGTSGRSAVSLFSAGEWATLAAASFARSSHRLGRRPGTRTADVTSSYPLHLSAVAADAMRRAGARELHLAATDPLEQTVRRLNAFAPDTLVLFPSVGRLLVEEQEAGRLAIAPAAVICGAEVLTEETRHRMERAWGARVLDVYATTECGGIATECGRQPGMHVWEDLLIVENVDGDDRPVPPGAYGEKLLVTALFKRSQPLIRYQLEDSVRLTEGPCPCGQPWRRIGAVQGRLEDVLRFPGAIVHPLLFHNLLDTLPVAAWQVVQGPDDGVRVLLAGAFGPLDDGDLAGRVAAALAAQGVAGPRVTVERVAAIPPARSGKTPLVTRAG